MMASPVLIVIRSLLFNVLFYLVLVVALLVLTPALLMPRPVIIGVAKWWSAINAWLLRTVCGIRVRIVGAEKIPAGAVIVAAKHQSAWETIALVGLFRDPAFVIKRELSFIPWFGWFAWKSGAIMVDRDAGGGALRRMSARAKAALAAGRQVVIFPEGTRRPVGAEPQYRPGVAQFYAAAGVACLPIALNSGLFWRRRSFRRYPGTIRLEVLDPIPPGLDKRAFLARLEHDVEAATARLVAEGKRELAESGLGQVAAAAG